MCLNCRKGQGCRDEGRNTMTDYRILLAQTEDFLETEPFYVPFLANLSALLFETLDNINWAGFYLMREGRLVLGPFCGKPACIHIEVGKGVCGTAVKEKRTVRVQDVHAFPGHIACDAASRSEIVIPVHKNGEIVGVLDIDSPVPDRFTPEDQEGLETIIRKTENSICYN